ncbi:MAG: TonB-dependent receptor [Ferruginibacter sp.]
MNQFYVSLNAILCEPICKKTIIGCLMLAAPIFIFAQSDSAQLMPQVVVTGFQPNKIKNTSLNIQSYSLNKINERNPFNLSDALAKLPGISQMTTGNAISKPVIRGLYGNRILVLTSGLRFDNQQWQDEHGLGLSQMGIDRVEIIKGPASLLYGSDALGAVINIIETVPIENATIADISSQLFTNTLGTITDVGLNHKNNRQWWKVHIGAESHTDYSDGNNTRVLNSRNNSYILKAGYGFNKNKWTQENNYNFSYNNFGFIIDSLTTFFTADERRTRKMSGPHHIVMLNMLNSQNTFQLKHSLLKINAGLQSNSRKEDEGGGSISLNMHLFSALENIRWEKELNKITSVVLNQQLTFENNTNYGGRIIIPDANLAEANLAGYLKFRLNKFILEAGAGCNFKYIKTFSTNTLNDPGKIIQPFTKNNFTGNMMLGMAYNPDPILTIKINSASGFRSPNLAELSSNGLHEGVFRYEIGDPTLKLEQNINTDISLEVNHRQYYISGSVFYNYFFNYVYLAPTNELFYTYHVFRYKQQDAKLYGAELNFLVKPVMFPGVEWKESFSSTTGILKNGQNLPFIPAYKLLSSIRFEKQLNRKLRKLFIDPEWLYVFRQDKPAQFETSTGGYGLLNIHSGLEFKGKSHNWIFGLSANNITNTLYADHLSRLKYYGLYNQGINFILSARRSFRL